MNNDLAHFMALPYRIVLHPDPNGGFAVSVPDLPGCLSQGDTTEEALAMIEDAKLAWISTALEDGHTVPKPAKDHGYSGKLVVRMPKTLHKTLAEQAESEGVSLNQFILYRLSQGRGSSPQL